MRIPRPRLSFLTGFLVRPVFLYSLYTLTLFLVFLVVTFPHDIVVRRVLDLMRNPTVAIDFNTARLAWGGYELQGVRFATLPLREGVPPVLEWTRLRVRPDYGALLRGDLFSYVVSGELYGGHASGHGSLHDGTVEAEIKWSGIDVRRYRAVSNWLDEGQLTGTLSGDWTMRMPRTPPGAVQGNGEIVLDHAAIADAKVKGFVIPDLQLTEAHAKVDMKANQVELQELTATGNDIGVQATGTLALRQPTSESSLNMRVAIQKLPETLKPLLAFIPHRGPKRATVPMNLTIGGTISHPMVH